MCKANLKLMILKVKEFRRKKNYQLYMCPVLLYSAENKVSKHQKLCIWFIVYFQQVPQAIHRNSLQRLFVAVHGTKILFTRIYRQGNFLKDFWIKFWKIVEIEKIKNKRAKFQNLDIIPWYWMARSLGKLCITKTNRRWISFKRMHSHQVGITKQVLIFIKKT